MVLLTAITAAAACLRTVRLSHGLPDFQEEAIPLRIALTLDRPATGAVDWNPHSFNYPSLSIYIHYFVQHVIYAIGHARGLYARWADYILAYWRDPTPMVVGARMVGVISDLLAICGVVAIGRRFSNAAGWIGGGLAALAPTLIVTSHSVFTDSVMAALATWAVERSLAWFDRGRPRDLVLAAVLIGASAGAKYPAATLLVPLAYLAFRRDRSHALGAIAISFGIAAGVFLLTTPYALLDARSFVRDFGFEGAHAQSGHFGSLEHRSFAYHAANLLRNLGAPAALALAASFVQLLRDRARKADRAALWLALMGFAVPISLARIDADRYLAPVILLACPLVGDMVATAVSRLRLLSSATGGAMRLAWAVSVLLVLGPAAFAGTRAALSSASTTQADARHWLERHLGPHELLIQEGYGASLVTTRQLATAMTDPAFDAASPRAQELLRSTPAFHSLSLPLPVAGPIDVAISSPPPARVVGVFAQSSEIASVFYEPSLYAEADYFLTSGSVRGRFVADARRYPQQGRFYATLDSTAELVAEFKPGSGIEGPLIRLYRLGPRWREFATRAPLDPLWWARGVPIAVRRQIAVAGDSDSLRGAEGATAAWVTALRPMFDEHVGGYVADLATECTSLAKFKTGATLADAFLAQHPQDPQMAVASGICHRKLGEFAAARLALEQAMIPSANGTPTDPGLLVESARLSLATADSADARRTLEQAIASAGPTSAVSELARKLLAGLRTPPGR